MAIHGVEPSAFLARSLHWKHQVFARARFNEHYSFVERLTNMYKQEQQDRLYMLPVQVHMLI